LESKIYLRRAKMPDYKVGIHTKDFDKLIEEIRKEIPQPYSGIVVGLLYKYATSYI
jgi:ribosomal protein L1